VISAVREFQRTLRRSGGASGVEVLLRCDLPSPIPSAPLPDDRTASRHTARPPASIDDAVESAPEATVMETYRLAAAADGLDADARLRAFLAALESAALPLADLRRGARHVELFAPCAS
jgi:hypothetical protein